MPLPEYHKITDATHFLKAMIAMLGKHSLAPNLINITLIYTHVSNSNRTLSKELENILNTKNTLSEEDAKELYQAHILDEDKRKNLKLNDTLKEQFVSFANDMRGFIGNTGDSQKNIKEHSEALKNANDPTQMTKVVESIVDEMHKIVENNAIFEKELEKKQNELEILKKELDVVREQVDTDALTQLKNRRFFETYIRNEMYLASRKHYPLSLIMLDIDFFKRVNDTHGHPVGDKVIIFVADAITEIVGDKAVVARIGGEEYAILFSNIAIENVKRAAELIRKRIEDANIKKKENSNDNIKITVSQGITVYQQDEKMQTFIDRADTALYESKNTGRNKVTFAD